MSRNVLVKPYNVAFCRILSLSIIHSYETERTAGYMDYFVMDDVVYERWYFAKICGKFVIFGGRKEISLINTFLVWIGRKKCRVVRCWTLMLFKVNVNFSFLLGNDSNKRFYRHFALMLSILKFHSKQCTKIKVYKHKIELKIEWNAL